MREEQMIGTTGEESILMVLSQLEESIMRAENQVEYPRPEVGNNVISGGATPMPTSKIQDIRNRIIDLTLRVNGLTRRLEVLG